MIDFSNVSISKMVIHKVGNKVREEGVFISDNLQNLTDKSKTDTILKLAINPFSNNQHFYRFNHDVSLQFNEVYCYVNNVFKDNTSFYKESVNIVNHLYNQSYHPRIKNGELYLIYLKDININGQTTDAIGIYKSESKDTYLKIVKQKTNIQLEKEHGISIKNIDKACLIYNINHELGYMANVLDTSNRNNEAQYWLNDFLNMSVLKNDYYQTECFIKAYNSFIEKNIETNDDTHKELGVKHRKKTIEFFLENEKFDINHFSNTVIGDDKIIKDFLDYSKDPNNSVNQIGDTFDISEIAVKKFRKKLSKSIIFLDDIIEIRIKVEATEDSKKILEKEYDPIMKKYYYKIYFSEEK